MYDFAILQLSMTSRQFANEQVIVFYSKHSYCITFMSLPLVREARTQVYMHTRPMYWYGSHVSICTYDGKTVYNIVYKTCLQRGTNLFLSLANG